ncbi:unnamed protein product [Diabrotica balteata]|uniref:Uncharacterized protein n=1 Tax=Diabrotica balteata TaxID=107213 RepID=A0A9N9XC24_DIABA|nr:unnamed protein product [Diabrotica balteata]
MCQDTDLAGQTENNDDDVEAEQDELLLESAGDVIPKFSAAVRPDDLMSYFPNILQLMSARTKKQHSISQRSFAFGTLAECMKSLGIYVEKFVPTLLNLWFTGARDSADEVRNNAIFGLGEMILHGKDKILSLPTSSNNVPNFTLNKQVRKINHTTTTNKCRATSPILPHTSVSTSNKRPTPKSNPIIPNPYRDEFIDYKKKLILPVTSHINQLMYTNNQSKPICNLENELRKLISNNLEETGNNTETDNLATSDNESIHSHY